ncbi:MAG: cysteine hydrolase [Deltaproteobacteria bacterium]|jgi:bifunctional isochorismate lyase / aryl carrier protein|nr:cysteine hydrolase [Deltaproteobacteria bacterium]
MNTKFHTLNNSALLVIDMQRYFLAPEERAFLDPPRELIPNILSLISTFRKCNRPTVFTRHAHKKDEPTGQMGRWWNDELPWDGDEDSEIIKEINPTADEVVITKSCYSAFENTELDKALKKQGVDTVLLCGVMTNLCVETSARHAFMKGFQVVVVEDACATKNMDYHKASILNLSYGFADISITADILKILK